MSFGAPRQYFWKSKRLGFSKWLDTDFHLAKSLWGDRDVTKYISLNGYTDQMIVDRFNSELDHQKKYGLAYWPLFTLEDNKFVGVTGLRAFDYEPGDIVDGVYMLGYHLMKDAWGKGYATEATKACIKYAFEKLNALNLYSGHHPRNLASGQVLKKSGFLWKKDALIPCTGVHHPMYYYKPDERMLVKWMEDPITYFAQLEAKTGKKL
ncbi:N-acetyltransferase GCN5 [Tritrichomonas foetus]|uniref:N-acetyltransferase GCN5 n=1 Tax=Tritrichomonas foetus TaxID=1144522 RepID=A0A1J4KU07_9EUKA|nr:N-acetyltransferase GCN5 [Tritrichomonas foetus]|eukprot:OHT14618.1 N-acetyltransferase GCN5 [Tritrichomonas foetus]